MRNMYPMQYQRAVCLFPSVQVPSVYTMLVVKGNALRIGVGSRKMLLPDCVARREKVKDLTGCW